MTQRIMLVYAGFLLMAACQDSDVENLVGRLASPDLSESTAAVEGLCDSRQGRAALSRSVGPETALEVLAAAAGDADCFSALPPTARARYYLEAEGAKEPIERLVSLAAEAEPLLVRALGSGNEFASLRAGRALIARRDRIGKEARGALLEALTDLVAAGVKPGELEWLGDAAFLRLLRDSADDQRDALRGSVEEWWRGLPAERRIGLLGGSLQLEIAARKKYNLGTPAWVTLSVKTLRWLPGVGGLWLRTLAVRATVDGEDLGEKPWPMGQDLAMTREVNLELGTIVGARLEAEGSHTLRLAFTAEIVRPVAGSGLSDAKQVWSGEIAAGPISLDVVAGRLSEMIEAVADPEPDPVEAISISLHAGGNRVALWPVPDEPRVLELPAQAPQATIKVTFKAPLPVGLAFDVMATPGKPGVKRSKIGALCTQPASLGGGIRDVGKLDLSEIFSGGRKHRLRLELVPSVSVAYRDPRIASYWDRRLDLGRIELVSR